MTPLQSFARTILANAPKFEWSLQGMGMLRLYLPGEMRLHVWDHRFAYPNVSMIHDHLQWGLTSTVLSGQIVNVRYKEGEGRPHHWMRIKAGYDGKRLSDVQTMLLQRQLEEVYRAGQSYSQEPHEVHETAAVNGTVTLMQKRPTTDGEIARVFWPKGTEWGTAVPRPATEYEVCAITANALRLFDEECSRA